MTEKELIEEAKKKYPIGSILKNNKCKAKFTFRHDFRWSNFDGLILRSDSGDYTLCDPNGIWAEIVKYPENYVPPVENIINSFQLF